MSILSDIQLALKKSSEALRKAESAFIWDPAATALPVLRMSGDISAMTKDVEAELSYIYGDRTGTLTCKWQGSSSLAYPKKNYTIKMDNAFEAKDGWGEQKKYCLKANYIDASHARNIICATLWGEMVKSRSGADARLTALPNGGAIDGFPVLVYINDEYIGLYTWNIPKDEWMFGMGDGDKEAIICAETHTDATRFDGEALVDGTDFEMEFVTDEDNSDWVADSLNTLINACNVDNPNMATIGKYIDIQSAIDYCIFTCFVEGTDIYSKNYLLATYDGTKWFFSAYDLDTTFGNHWTGKSYGKHTTLSFATLGEQHKLMELILANMKDELVSRYNELRADILSEGNLLYLLTNFTCAIPQAAYNMESVIWPQIPGTASNNVSQIMNHMRLRLAWLDEEMNGTNHVLTDTVTGTDYKLEVANGDLTMSEVK